MKNWEGRSYFTTFFPGECEHASQIIFEVENDVVHGMTIVLRQFVRDADREIILNISTNGKNSNIIVSEDDRIIEVFEIKEPYLIPISAEKLENYPRTTRRE